MTDIRPGSPAWDDLRNTIVDLETAATEHTNAAREALLDQGDLFQQIAPKGDKGGPNGTGKLLEQMARECGIAPSTARLRRDLSARVKLRYVSQFRQLLTGAADVIISWETLRTILHDDQPEALLSRLIEEARAAGATRISRDDVRRSRGMVTGTVGTPGATAERIVRDPGFAAMLAADDDARLAMARAVSESEAHRQIRRDQTRHAQEEQAREAETVYHLAGARVLAVGWEATNLAEFIETKVLRTDEDIAAARNAGQWLQAIGRRIVAWADGLTVPLSDEDFAREIQTILQGGERA
jgi:hypothetical protein